VVVGAVVVVESVVVLGDVVDVVVDVVAWLVDVTDVVVGCGVHTGAVVVVTTVPGFFAAEYSRTRLEM